MRASCLINNFNYARYLPEAVDIALGQTVPFDEIIVVDDGSTDDSVDMLHRRYAGHSQVRIISQPNGGQLSCFNEGFVASRGDLVFFLDADDAYEPSYLETVLRLYAQRPEYDFVFCAPRLFGRENREDYRYSEDTDFGYTVARTWFDMPWIGNATSCISARRLLLERFLPLPITQDWRLCADGCLVHGAGLAGGRKFFLRQCLVRYRVHEGNGFFGREVETRDYRWRMKRDRLRGALAEKLGLITESIARLIAAEYATIPHPTWPQFRQYVRILKSSPLSRFTQRQMLQEIIRYHLQSKRAFRSWWDRTSFLCLRLQSLWAA